MRAGVILMRGDSQKTFCELFLDAFLIVSGCVFVARARHLVGAGLGAYVPSFSKKHLLKKNTCA